MVIGFTASPAHGESLRDDALPSCRVIQSQLTNNILIDLLELLYLDDESRNDPQLDRVYHYLQVADR